MTTVSSSTDSPVRHPTGAVGTGSQFVANAVHDAGTPNGERNAQEFIHESRVAYFSMEMALRSSIPTYSGGLGVLAGDTLRTAADLDLPMVGVSLVSRAGYFRQSFDAAGNQVESAAEWTPADVARLLSAKVALAIEGRQVWIGAWLYVLESHLGGRQPVLLLDSDFPENQPEDRQITARLYGGDELYRLKQEMVLGIGGARRRRSAPPRTDARPHRRDRRDRPRPGRGQGHDVGRSAASPAGARGSPAWRRRPSACRRVERPAGD